MTNLPLLTFVIITITNVYKCLTSEITSRKIPSKPHIFLIVADDLGWNDVSWHNPDVLTPNLKELAEGGVILNRSYVQPICTPTRSALMTGRYPFTIGRQRSTLRPSEPTGLTLNATLLPQAMKEAGYTTHAVGKWHLGFCSWSYTPTFRGFDTYYGYYNGAENYYTHMRSNLKDPLLDDTFEDPKGFEKETFVPRKDSLKDGTFVSPKVSLKHRTYKSPREQLKDETFKPPKSWGDETFESSKDTKEDETFVEEEDSHGNENETFEFDKAKDYLDLRNNTEPDPDKDGIYSPHLFASYVENLLESRDPADPMFLYLPFQSVHAPLMVPENYTTHYKHIHDLDRRIYLGMVTALDEAVGRIVESLRKTGHYDNSVIIFTTDNGGTCKHGGNNWPLRGMKATLWEGGTRGVAFVHSPLLPNPGTVSNELIHATDWFQTVVRLGGGVATNDTDGFDQWDVITGDKPSPRKRMIYNIDLTEKIRASVRIGNYKLIVGFPGEGDWTPPPEMMTKKREEGENEDEEEGEQENYKIFKKGFKEQEIQSGISSTTSGFGKTSPELNIIKDSEEGGLYKGKPYGEKSGKPHHIKRSDGGKYRKRSGWRGYKERSGLRGYEERSGLRGNRKRSGLRGNRKRSGLRGYEERSDGGHKAVTLELLRRNYVFGSGKDPFDRWDLGTEFFKNETQIRLYNIRHDPEERNDLSTKKIYKVKVLLEYLLEQIMTRYVPADIKPEVPSANPKYWNNIWSPGWCQA